MSNDDTCENHGSHCLACAQPILRRCGADMNADPPRDCDAPFCGCNPAWADCIGMLQESGWGELHPLQSKLDDAELRLRLLDAAVKMGIEQDEKADAAYAELESRLDSALEALRAMANDGWMYFGPEGMSAAQQKVYDVLEAESVVERRAPIGRYVCDCGTGFETQEERTQHRLTCWSERGGYVEPSE